MHANHNAMSLGRSILIVILAALAAFCLVYAAFPLATMLSGPEAAVSGDISDYEGDYVSMEIDCIYDQFAESQNTVLGIPVASYIYCAVPYGEEIIVVAFPSRYAQSIDAITEDTSQWLIYELDELTRYVDIRGYVEDMDEETAAFLADWCNGFLGEGYTSLLGEHIVWVDYVDAIYIPAVFVIFGIGIAAVVAALLLWAIPRHRQRRLAAGAAPAEKKPARKKGGKHLPPQAPTETPAGDDAADADADLDADTDQDTAPVADTDNAEDADEAPAADTDAAQADIAAEDADAQETEASGEKEDEASDA